MGLDRRERKRILAQITHRSGRILVADDDPLIRNLVTSILKNEGHGVIAVNDGREAIRILKSDCDFDAAIFGVRMPHLGGTEVILHMRTEKRLMRIPVLLITSEQSFTLMKDSFAAGATAFLSKPLIPGQVLTVVRMLLSQSTEIKGTTSGRQSPHRAPVNTSS